MSSNEQTDQLRDVQRFLRDHKSRILGPAALVLLGLGGQLAASHVVERGDTVYSLARENGVSVAAIATANNLSNPDRIIAGQKLAIPATTDVSIIVQPGDTVWSLAQAHGLSPTELIARNSLGSSARIFEGQRLWLPSSAVSADALPTNKLTFAERKAARAERKEAQEAQAQADAAEAEAAADKAAKRAAKKAAAKQADAESETSQETPTSEPEAPQAETETPAVEDKQPESGDERPVVPSPVVTTLYVVQAGDSVSSIASLFGIDAQLLADANGIAVDANLAPDSHLQIPSGGLI